MSLVITGKIAEAIISIAEKYGRTPEEYITMKILDDLDPKTRLKIYAGLFRKYYLEAKKLAEKGRYCPSRREVLGSNHRATKYCWGA